MLATHLHPSQSGTNEPVGSARRWAAITFTDIVGYSLLMSADERGTYERWMALLQTVVRPGIKRYSGRVVDLAGDGVLAEFSTPAEAVSWARELQNHIKKKHRNEGAVAALIALRISVHWGEVYVADGRIFGDAVNVAARLQDHAQPGWVVISEAVRAQLNATFMQDLQELGELELKNIGRPVRAYSINTGAIPVALPMPRPPQHALPSIAVLPLQNLGSDPADGYFADGIVEDIVLSLAGLRELFVIARSSTLAFRGTSLDVRQVGRALSVRYVLTGSLRRSARALRATFELSDVQTGATVWGGRMESALNDVFEMQDEVVRKVVTGIAPHIRIAEMQRMLRKRPESFTAYDLTLRALHALNDLSYDGWVEARRLLEMGMSEDPTFAMPVAWGAWWYSLYIGQGWSKDVTGDTAASLRLARKAITLDENNALGLAMLGHVLGFLSHEPEAALAYFSRAIDACPNSALVWMYSSNAFAYLGQGREAISRAQYALQLSPEDQHRFLIYARLGIAHYTLGAYEEAARWMRLSHMQSPTYTTALKGLIAALAGLGRIDEARGFVTTLSALEPGISLSSYEHTRVPFKDSALRIQFVEHLRQAGLPP